MARLEIPNTIMLDLFARQCSQRFLAGRSAQNDCARPGRTAEGPEGGTRAVPERGAACKSSREGQVTGSAAAAAGRVLGHLPYPDV